MFVETWPKMLELNGEQRDAFFSTPNLSARLLAHILSDVHPSKDF